MLFELVLTLTAVAAYEYGQRYPLPPEVAPSQLGLESQCTDPNTVYTCYVSYLEKYGIHSTGGYLGPYAMLDSKIKTLNLMNVCRDFNELTQCLGATTTFCINYNVFLLFVQRYRARYEALSYLQNHAFLEYVCGIGYQAFMDNEDCLQRTLEIAPLTNRMIQCGQESVVPSDPEVCPRTLSVTDCVKEQVTSACGYTAGKSACDSLIDDRKHAGNNCPSFRGVAASIVFDTCRGKARRRTNYRRKKPTASLSFDGLSLARAVFWLVAMRRWAFSFACLLSIGWADANAFDLMDGSMEPINPNYCNNSNILEEAGLIRATLGQFLGYECSEEFYHCRWQSDGFRTYRKKCKTGLVYDVLGTQNCNYDYNVRSCGIKSGAPMTCNSTDFHCALSEQCLPMSSRCDGHYDCTLEEDEQNCPLCTAGEFACVVSEQCIPLDRRCNGIAECSDGTDERDCDVCGHGLFHCGKSGECIPVDERCDGRRQCPHGEDELLCKKPDIDKKFTCQSRDYDIPFGQVCDGIPQCPDGSDEVYCELPKALGGISFSSNPNPPPEPAAPAPAPAPYIYPPTTEEETTPAGEEEEYEYEETPEEEEKPPSFPMLSLGQMPAPQHPPPPPPPRPTTPRPPPPTRPPTTTTQAPPPPPPAPRPAFSKPKPKIVVPPIVEQVEATTHKHIIVQPTYVEVTAPSRPVSNNAKRTRYPTKAVPMHSATPTSAPATRPPTIKPATQKSRQLFESSPGSQKPATEKVFMMQVTAAPRTPTVAVKSTAPQSKVKLTPPVVDSKDELLQQISNQLNGGMSPDLLSKIEKILSTELESTSSTRRRKPSSGQTISPAALIRTFTARVQGHNEQVQN
ncbi:unnamed protein product [Caenorhabditis auriculariae]|uniref:Chitin-binding type-2 domain-containing protein n=1 Tax=Caenorhabditis auriculariae TaxID=2777116 RepID=A0A8S1HH80_9PELO|nr:unnamed protein product [Caenorhabditis auriculariae]